MLCVVLGVVCVIVSLSIEAYARLFTLMINNFAASVTS
jgi:hypothetical protein